MSSLWEYRPQKQFWMLSHVRIGLDSPEGCRCHHRSRAREDCVGVGSRVAPAYAAVLRLDDATCSGRNPNFCDGVMNNWKEAARHFRKMCLLYEGRNHPQCVKCGASATGVGHSAENSRAGWSWDPEDDIWFCRTCAMGVSDSAEQKQEEST